MLIAEMNKRLEERYGKDLISNRAKFRIVWSDSQLEKRYGTFNEFYGSIFVRETVGMKEVPKYGYLPPCWVLEQLQYADNPELAERSSYEPLWPFLSKAGESLPPVWRAVELIMDSILNRSNVKRVTSKNEQDVISEEDRKAIEYFENALDMDSDLLTKVVW